MRANYYLVFLIGLFFWTNSTSQSGTPINSALESGDIALLSNLIAGGADLNAIYRNKNDESVTPICYASCIGNLDVVKLLISEGASLTIREDYVYDALTESIKCGQAHIVGWFLGEGHYSTMPEDELKSYLYLSLENDDINTFNMLLNKIPSAQTPNTYTDLMFSAAMNQKPNLFQHLVTLGADIYAPNNKGGGSEGESVMHVAASSQAILAFLMGKGFDVNTQAPNEQTPLHLCQNADAAAFLLSQGADIEAKDKFGWSPLHYAIFDGDVGVVDVLLQNGADKSAETKAKFNTIYPDLTIKKGANCLDIIKQITEYHNDNKEKIGDYETIKTMINS